jgi:hypothetical protein
MKTTELEAKTLVNIAQNLLSSLNGAIPQTFEDTMHGCWTDCVGSDGPYELSGKQLSGIFSSLTKKGLIISDSGSEGATELTEAGFTAYQEAKANGF